MPKVADPAIRVALIENAARIIAEEGRDALTLRRLAAEVGASTMAIYTHFGSMDDLRRAVRREGFNRLAAHLGAVDDTGDAVADLIVLGAAYYANATTNPNLYRAIFLDAQVDPLDSGIDLGTFNVLIRTVERCVAAGRITGNDPERLAYQLWAIQHGAITLQLVGLLTPDIALDICTETARNLLLAHGDSPAAIGRSFQRALSR